MFSPSPNLVLLKCAFRTGYKHLFQCIVHFLKLCRYKNVSLLQLEAARIYTDKMNRIQQILNSLKKRVKILHRRFFQLYLNFWSLSVQLFYPIHSRYTHIYMWILDKLTSKLFHSKQLALSATNMIMKFFLIKNKIRKVGFFAVNWFCNTFPSKTSSFPSGNWIIL